MALLTFRLPGSLPPDPDVFLRLLDDTWYMLTPAN